MYVSSNIVWFPDWGPPLPFVHQNLSTSRHLLSRLSLSVLCLGISKSRCLELFICSPEIFLWSYSVSVSLSPAIIFILGVSTPFVGGPTELLTLNTLLLSVSGNFQLIVLSGPVVTYVAGAFFGSVTPAFLNMTTTVVRTQSRLPCGGPYLSSAGSSSGYVASCSVSLS